MKRLALAAMIVTLAVPASAAAARAVPASAAAARRSFGVVLSARQGAFQVIDVGRRVDSYRLAKPAPALRIGDKISFESAQGEASDVAITGVTTRLVYLGQVVGGSSRWVRVRLADGDMMVFAAGQVQGVRDGQRSTGRPDGHGTGILPAVSRELRGRTVLVDETVEADGSPLVTLTIVDAAAGGHGSGHGSHGGSSPSGGGSGSGTNGGGSSSPGGSSGAGGGSGSGSDAVASGIVTDVEGAGFGIVVSGGTVMRFEMDANALAAIGMNPCDVVSVSYRKTAGGALVADSVDDSDTSSTDGSCYADGTYYPTQDETGPITSMSAASITLDTPDHGSITFEMDPTVGLTSGFSLGDVVDVTFEPVPGGIDYAVDVEYVENQSVGVVTAVSVGSMTITDSTTGQPDVFVADPSDEVFEGVAIGDLTLVTWHQAAGRVMVADGVQDMGPGS